MATNKEIVPEVVKRLQDSLKELDIKSETQSSADEAIIYSKFSIDKERYRIVIHLQKEDYKARAEDSGASEINDAQEDCAVTPNLNFQTIHSNTPSYSREENLKIKQDFLEEAAKILPRIKR